MAPLLFILLVKELNTLSRDIPGLLSDIKTSLSSVAYEAWDRLQRLTGFATFSLRSPSSWKTALVLFAAIFALACSSSFLLSAFLNWCKSHLLKIVLVIVVIIQVYCRSYSLMWILPVYALGMGGLYYVKFLLFLFVMCRSRSILVLASFVFDALCLWVIAYHLYPCLFPFFP